MTFFSTHVLFNGLAKTDVHSHKFIRLARSAKLSNLSFLKDFTFFKDNKPSSLSSHVSPTRACLSSQNLLLFLNQGLSAKELTKLRFNLKILGISFTHIPTRFWSNSFVRFNNFPGFSKTSLSPFCSPSSSFLKSSSLQKSFKKTIYGNILAFYLSKDSSRCYPSSDSIYLLYQFLQNNLIHQHHLQSYFVHNKDLVNLFSTDSDIQSFVGFSRLTLPWDLLSSQVVEDRLASSDLASFMLSSWFQESSDDSSLNHVNLLFTYLKNHRLTYAGFVNSKPFVGCNSSGSSSLFFDNFDLLSRSRSNLSSSVASVASVASALSSPRVSNFNFYKDNTFFCFEPFLFNSFNKLYLSYL